MININTNTKKALLFGKEKCLYCKAENFAKAI